MYVCMYANAYMYISNILKYTQIPIQMPESHKIPVCPGGPQVLSYLYKL